jgi:hypothetical protein
MSVLNGLQTDEFLKAHYPHVVIDKDMSNNRLSILALELERFYPGVPIEALKTLADRIGPNIWSYCDALIAHLIRESHMNYRRDYGADEP